MNRSLDLPNAAWRAGRTFVQTLSGAYAGGELVLDADFAERLLAAFIAAFIAASVAFFMNAKSEEQDVPT